MTEERAREILHMELYGAPEKKVYDGWLALLFCHFEEDGKVVQDVRYSEATEMMPKAVRIESRLSGEKDRVEFFERQAEMSRLRSEALETLLSLGYTFV